MGSSLPWPEWVHADATLAQVARWLRRYHDAVADFVPPAAAVWRMGGQWAPGLIVGHNDAAPYNAVWRDGRAHRGMCGRLVRVFAIDLGLSTCIYSPKGHFREPAGCLRGGDG